MLQKWKYNPRWMLGTLETMWHVLETTRLAKVEGSMSGNELWSGGRHWIVEGFGMRPNREDFSLRVRGSYWKRGISGKSVFWKEMHLSCNFGLTVKS